jgi:hypothetical membrane protein
MVVRRWPRHRRNHNGTVALFPDRGEIRFDDNGGVRSRLLFCGVPGSVVFVVSFLVQGVLRSDYDPLRHPVSALSLGPAGWVQMGTFWLVGLLIAGYAVGLRRAGCGWWTPVLVGLVGLGLVGAGVFAADPISGYPPGSPVPAPRTAHGVAHDLCSTPVFTALPASMVVMARRFVRDGAPGWAWYSLTSAVVFLGCFVLSSLGFNQNSVLMPVGGLWQRLALVVGFGWLAALALRTTSSKA